jgi:cytochrome c nitrite reductase small subunit
VRRFTLASSLIGGLFGVSAGIGGFTFFYANGASYLGHDSSACANCHVMRDQYDGWIKSSHRGVAECNDCHTPPGLVPKYAVKALNGFRHSWAFTSGRFHEPIQINAMNRAIAERACRHCHDDVVEAMVSGSSHGDRRGEVACLRCHGSVGHPELSPVALRSER